METIEPTVRHKPLFEDIGMPAHMPFFDGKTLVFCRSNSKLTRTFSSAGTIWKSIRRSPALTEHFKDLPRTQQVSYRPWKLVYCNWKDRVIRPISTGLPENVSERSPCFYWENGTVHLSFLGGVTPTYQLYTCSGPDLEHLTPPQPLPHRPVFLGFVSPHHICWGTHNRFELTEKATGKTLRFKTSFVRISHIGFTADDPSRLLLTGYDRTHQPNTVLYELSTGKISDVSVDGPIYKASLHGDKVVFSEKRKEGFENRDICFEAYALSPSAIQIVPEK